MDRLVVENLHVAPKSDGVLTDNYCNQNNRQISQMFGRNDSTDSVGIVNNGTTIEIEDLSDSGFEHADVSTRSEGLKLENEYLSSPLHRNCIERTSQKSQGYRVMGRNLRTQINIVTPSMRINCNQHPHYR